MKSKPLTRDRYHERKVGRQIVNVARAELHPPSMRKVLILPHCHCDPSPRAHSIGGDYLFLILGSCSNLRYASGKPGCTKCSIGGGPTGFTATMCSSIYDTLFVPTNDRAGRRG